VLWPASSRRFVLVCCPGVLPSLSALTCSLCVCCPADLDVSRRHCAEAHARHVRFCESYQNSRRFQNAANGLEGMPRTYKNSIDCLRKIVQGEGALGLFVAVCLLLLLNACCRVAALFSGCRANVLRAIPGTAIQFWSYEAIKTLFGVEPISS
jgi:hypothetical protein